MRASYKKGIQTEHLATSWLVSLLCTEGPTVWVHTGMCERATLTPATQLLHSLPCVRLSSLAGPGERDVVISQPTDRLGRLPFSCSSWGRAQAALALVCLLRLLVGSSGFLVRPEQFTISTTLDHWLVPTGHPLANGVHTLYEVQH